MVDLNWFKNNKDFVVLAGVGLIFLFVYSWLSIGIEPRFTSPDETANYYFIKSLAEKGQLRFYEPLNQITEGLVRPRSMGFVNGYTVPGSFLGMILIYGIIAKFFGSWIILYLTPLFSVIGVLFFYLLLKEIFNREVAFISSLLLFFLPPFWHYSSRGMFHNILFVDLLIIGLYFLTKFFTSDLPTTRFRQAGVRPATCLRQGFGRQACDQRPACTEASVYAPPAGGVSADKSAGPLRRSFSEASRRATSLITLSGFFIGLALITRTSEITWVGIILLVLFILNRSRINCRHLLFFAGPIILLFLPIFFLNNHLYGSPFSFAYSQGSINTTSLETVSQTFIFKLRQVLFPFDISFSRTSQMVYQYLVVIFPWLSILFVITFCWLFKNIIIGWLKKIFPDLKISFQLESKQKIYPDTFVESHSGESSHQRPWDRGKGVGAYLWLYSLMAVWLIIYYGSYSFYEYIDSTKILLGSSYLRYWLPIYVFGLPFLAMAIIRIKYFFKSPVLKYFIPLFLIILIIFFSVSTVLLDPLYGLGKIKGELKDSQRINREIIRVTEANSVIIAGKADKFFFPERKVIVSFPIDNNSNKKSLAIFKNLKSQKISVYYYQVVLDENNERFMKLVNDLNLNLVEIKEFLAGETLYRID